MQYYKATHKISVIICTAFCNAFVLYPYYNQYSEKDLGLDTILSLFQLNPPSAE